MIYSLRLILQQLFHQAPPASCLQHLTDSLPVDHSRQPFPLKWDRKSIGLVSTVFFRKKYLFWELVNVFFIKKYFFQIKLYKMISRYKTMHILLINVHLYCRGRIPVTGMLAGMNLSKPGMNQSKPGMNLSKPGKTQQSCYNRYQNESNYI